MLSTMLLSICTHFYQLVIVQGLCTGLAYGMMWYRWRVLLHSLFDDTLDRTESSAPTVDDTHFHVGSPSTAGSPGQLGYVLYMAKVDMTLGRRAQLRQDILRDRVAMILLDAHAVIRAILPHTRL